MRLAAIDAPEKRQPYGQRSKQSLADLVYGKQVTVNQQDRDRYGRIVGRVYTKSLDVNAEQIKRGMASIYLKYNRDRSLLALEQEARGAKRGLWSDLNPIPPWEYRHGGAVGSGRRSTAQALVKVMGDQLCGGKRYCNDMGSCEEAKFHLKQCGLSRLDRDGDGGAMRVIVSLIRSCPMGEGGGYQARNDRADDPGRARSALHISLS